MHGEEQRRNTMDSSGPVGVVDVVLGVGTTLASWTTKVTRPLASTAIGLLELGDRITRGEPRTALVADLAERGTSVRVGLERALGTAARQILRWSMDAALTALDVTELVRGHVDLDAIAEDIDVDAVVARADLDEIIARLDVDSIIARLDLDGIIARLDLDAIAARIDLDGVVARIDLNRAASRIDLDGIVARIDLDGIIARVNLDAAIGRLDLAGIARDVIEAVDLPEIMRESTGAVSSQAARVVRTEGMHADDAVASFVDRILRRPHPGGPVTA